jgi:hypothetical protein
MTTIESTLETRVAQLEQELGRLRSELARLDADLDESRRLNLRAAELLDMVYELLGRAQNGGGPGSDPKPS